MELGGETLVVSYGTAVVELGVKLAVSTSHVVLGGGIFGSSVVELCSSVQEVVGQVGAGGMPLEDMNTNVNVVGISGAGPVGVTTPPGGCPVAEFHSDVVQSSELIELTGCARVLVGRDSTSEFWLVDSALE
jgi:hypothetical protein